MHSTDHNLNNPTIVDQLGVTAEVNMEREFIADSVTQEEFDRMANPDPYRIYFVKDENSTEMFLGKNKIRVSTQKLPRYMIAPSEEFEGEWNIIHQERGHLSIIGQDTLENAVLFLNEMRQHGENGGVKEKLYSAVENYIRYHISLDEAIVGCIVALGIPSNSPDLQKLTSWLIMKEDRTGNQKMERMLDYQVERIPGGIAGLYKRIYDWFLINDFFIKLRKTPEEELLPIGSELDDLYRTYVDWVKLG